jgi:hypothetical protein
MKMRIWAVAGLVAALALFGLPGCNGDDNGNGNGDGNNTGDGNNNGDTNSNTDKGPGTDKGDGGGGSDPGYCNEISLSGTKVPPNLLFVVDKSGSMGEKFDPNCSGWNCPTKIASEKTALTSMLTAGQGKIRFGWMQYPASGSCEAGTVSVQCSDASFTQVQTQVNWLSEGGGTPTGDSLIAANAYNGLHDATRSNFVVLLTDGMPTCPDGQGQNEVESDKTLARNAVSTLKTGGVDTFVIGIGSGTAANPTFLNDLAELGGRPLAGATKYYQANSLDDLNQALADIGGAVMGCSIFLTPPPEWPDYLWVWVNDTQVARDKTHTNGWDYDANSNQIIFYGDTCTTVKTSGTTVEVKMGCAPPA